MNRLENLKRLYRNEMKRRDQIRFVDVEDS